MTTTKTKKKTGRPVGSKNRDLSGTTLVLEKGKRGVRVWLKR